MKKFERELIESLYPRIIHNYSESHYSNFSGNLEADAKELLRYGRIIKIENFGIMGDVQTKRTIIYNAEIYLLIQYAGRTTGIHIMK